MGRQLKDGIDAAIEEAGISAQLQQMSSVWALYFTRKPIQPFRDMAAFSQVKNHQVHAAYQRWMLARGVYIHPHFFIRGYLNDAHTSTDVADLIAVSRSFFIKQRSELEEPYFSRSPAGFRDV